MIGGEELKEMIALRSENARLKRELSEALRQLNKTTGMRWNDVIAQRALPQVERVTCEPCEGRGEFPIDKWAQSMDVEPQRCTECNGDGEVYRYRVDTKP